MCTAHWQKWAHPKRGFDAMTLDIEALTHSLSQEEVIHVAMKSTGVYWKPIYNILAGRFTILLVNARHVKNVPGRKTDVKDSQWFAQLLQYGLFTASFIPDKAQKELRDLTRHRAENPCFASIIPRLTSNWVPALIHAPD